MRTIRILCLSLAAAAAVSLPAFPADSKPPAPAPDPEILALRESAWRAWFAGDEATLRGMLPPEFLGIGMDDSPFSDLESTLRDSREYAARGGRLVRLEFPETRAQRLGDTVILYGRYSVVLESEGVQRTFAGRLTEVFVRRDGKWWHPGWHLDVVSTPPTAGAAG